MNYNVKSKFTSYSRPSAYLASSEKCTKITFPHARKKNTSLFLSDFKGKVFQFYNNYRIFTHTPRKKSHFQMQLVTDLPQIVCLIKAPLFQQQQQ